MELTPTSLRAFLAVAEELHFGRAARRLNTSTPTLSQQIKRLEQQLEFTVLTRTSRRVQLTRHGRELVEFARHVVASNDELGAWIERVRSGKPTLRVGFWTNGAGSLMSDIISATLLDMADLDLRLRHFSWGRLPQAVLGGEVDVAFVREPFDPADLRRTLVVAEPRVLAVRADHRLAGMESVSILDTRNETFVAPEGVSETERNWWLVDPRPDGSRPITGPLAGDLEEILELVAAGMGVNITGASVAAVTRRRDIAFVPVRDIDDTRIILIAREHSLDPVVARFEELVASIAAGNQPT